MNRSEWALQLRVSLIEAIAGRLIGRSKTLYPICELCLRPFPVERLEVDHRHGKTWRAGRLNFLDRIRRYWREFDRGVALRALCRSCNASHGSRMLRGRRRYA